MRRETAKRLGSDISAELASCERAVDLSLMSAMRMGASMIEARLGLGMNICVKNDLVQEAGYIIAADMLRRNQLIRMHAALADMGQKLGVDPNAMGDGGVKDDAVYGIPASGGANDGLKAVA